MTDEPENPYPLLVPALAKARNAKHRSGMIRDHREVVYGMIERAAWIRQAKQQPTTGAPGSATREG